MTDLVNHPPHYADGWSNGAEVIDITEHLNFNRGNAAKYIARAGKKNPDTEVEDIQKAIWYLQRELYRLGEGPRDAMLDAKIESERSPRVWASLAEVPHGTLVETEDPNEYIYVTPEGGGWFVDRGERPDVKGWTIDEDDDVLGPFTEVLETA